MLVKRKRRKGPGQEGLITASPFLMPSLIGLLVFSLLPLLISAFISLTDWNGLDQLTAPGFFQEHFIGLDNYKAILSSPEFWGVLWNTFRYIIMYIPLMLVASLGVAYLLSRQRPGVTAFRIIYYIPVLTSWVAASMIWKSMLSPEYGAVNNILAVFGIQGPGWLLDEAWAMPAIVLVSVWKDTGSATLPQPLFLRPCMKDSGNIPMTASVSGRLHAITIPVRRGTPPASGPVTWQPNSTRENGYLGRLD